MIRKKLVLLILSLILVFSQTELKPKSGYAATSSIQNQGQQYLQGDYSPTAEQPYSYNWNRISSFNGIAKNPYKKWTYTPPETYTLKYFRSSPAIDYDGTIYAGFADGNMFALNKDGSLKWKYDTKAQLAYASPIISSDGSIIFGSGSGLHSLDRNGNLKWVSPSGQCTPALSNNGVVYVTSRAKKLYAVNSNNGNIIWSKDLDNYADGAPAIGSDGTIYVATYASGDLTKSSLTAFNSDGSQKWKYNFPELGTGYSGFGSPAISNDGSTIYIGNKDKKLYAINTNNGSLKWTFTTNGNLQNTPLIDQNGTLYFGSYDDDKFYAINPDGTIKWTFSLGQKDNVYGAPILDASGNIFFKTWYYVYSIDTNGKLKWKLNPTEDVAIQSSLAMASDGTLYVGGGYKLIAIGGEQEFTICEKANYLDSLIDSGLDTQEKVDNAKAELEKLQQKVQEYQNKISEAELNLNK